MRYIKVVRVIEYTGEEEWVRHTLDRSERSVITPKGVMREVYRSDGIESEHEAVTDDDVFDSLEHGQY